MRQQPILDFSDDGKAVVEIPEVGEMAFLNTFGLSKISDVEKDVELADTPERKAFLKKYIEAFQQTFGEEPVLSKKTSEQLDRFKSTLISQMPIFDSSLLDYSEYTDEKYDEAWDIVDENDSDEFNKAFDNHILRQITVNVFTMKHTTAWYLFGHVEADIEATVKQIECMKGLPTIIDNIDKVMGTVRKALDVRVAKTKLMEELGLTKDQAAYALGFRLSELAGIQKERVQENIADSEKLLAMLKMLT